MPAPKRRAGAPLELVTGPPLAGVAVRRAGALTFTRSPGAVIAAAADEAITNLEAAGVAGASQSNTDLVIVAVAAGDVERTVDALGTILELPWRT